VKVLQRIIRFLKKSGSPWSWGLAAMNLRPAHVSEFWWYELPISG
jgi:hypothetical protein